MEKKVLVVDDDESLLELLDEYLKPFGFTLTKATTGPQGVRLALGTGPDLVVLDCMLPGKDGFEVCREIRRESEVPIIMLTARGGVTDRIVGLELGADDYLPKPFEPRELVARMQSLLRRAGEKGGRSRITSGDLVIDIRAHTASLEGEPLDLSTSEYDLLVLLASNPGRILTRDHIMDRLRGIDWAAFQRSVDVLVSRLRQKLRDDPKRPRFIKTIWGTGYTFLQGGP